LRSAGPMCGDSCPLMCGCMCARRGCGRVCYGYV
jgi:hypothetical protein